MLFSEDTSRSVTTLHLTQRSLHRNLPWKIFLDDLDRDDLRLDWIGLPRSRIVGDELLKTALSSLQDPGVYSTTSLDPGRTSVCVGRTDDHETRGRLGLPLVAGSRILIQVDRERLVQVVSCHSRLERIHLYRGKIFLENGTPRLILTWKDLPGRHEVLSSLRGGVPPENTSPSWRNYYRSLYRHGDIIAWIISL